MNDLIVRSDQKWREDLEHTQVGPEVKGVVANCLGDQTMLERPLLQPIDFVPTDNTAGFSQCRVANHRAPSKIGIPLVIINMPPSILSMKRSISMSAINLSNFLLLLLLSLW